MKPIKKLPHHVVVGAGYAGLPIALRLNHLAKGQCRVSIVNPDTKQELTCDLYRTLRNGKSYLFPFAETLKKSGIDFVEGRLHDLNPDRNMIQVRAQSPREIHYDKLILATGLNLKTPAIDGLDELLESDRESMRKRIFSFKKNNHAQALRLAMSRIGWGATQRGFAKDTFVVILGAGSTGLEVAGELAALRGKSKHERIILIDEKTSLLQDFSPFAGKVLNKKLRKMGIETVLGSPVVSINETELKLRSGQVIPWEVLITCSGTLSKPSWSDSLAKTSFDNGFKVDQNFLLQNQKNIFALGDLASFDTSQTNYYEKQMPKRAQFAYQGAKFLANNLATEILKHRVPIVPFEYSDLGYLISLGPNDGIARLGPAAKTKIGKVFSPFIQGPQVDRMKRIIRLGYLLQLRAYRYKISL